MDNENLKEKIDYWLTIAAYDLDTANAMLQTKRYLYVGFMCHQVIEKTLKALYIKNCLTTPPYRHNLSYIAQQGTIYSKLSEEQKNLLDELEPMNIESRYPAYKEKIYAGLSEQKCIDLLERTTNLFIWLKQQL